MNNVTYSAPGRCGILGNPSDIYGGQVVSCSLPVRNRCTVREDGRGEVPADNPLWEALVRDYPLETWPYEPGFSVEWQSEVPRSAGLAGSTALLAATLRHRLPDWDLRTFAEEVRRIEMDVAGIVCGYQDAYMVCLGGLRHLTFARKSPYDPGPLAESQTLDADLPFLLITTDVQRLSGSVHGPMVERWMAGDATVRSAMLHLAELGQQAATELPSGNWHALADLMHENFAIIQSLGGSGAAIDQLVEAAEREGALAAKLAGAGMGGTVIALTHDPAELESRLRARGYARFLRPAIQAGLRIEM